MWYRVPWNPVFYEPYKNKEWDSHGEEKYCCSTANKDLGDGSSIDRFTNKPSLDIKAIEVFLSLLFLHSFLKFNKQLLLRSDIAAIRIGAKRACFVVLVSVETFFGVWSRCFHGTIYCVGKLFRHSGTLFGIDSIGGGEMEMHIMAGGYESLKLNVALIFCCNQDARDMSEYCSPSSRHYE
mmetsp:Transcript_18910/g.34858  ORF Transcript_18910/g.34858 Transcript_18910/m.34858 type:complete len:181 (-) Transcript_18910:24-566(-)